MGHVHVHMACAAANHMHRSSGEDDEGDCDISTIVAHLLSYKRSKAAPMQKYNEVIDSFSVESFPVSWSGVSTLNAIFTNLSFMRKNYPRYGLSHDPFLQQ